MQKHFPELQEKYSNMEKLKKILRQVSDIVLVEQTEQKERWKRGECFNIFDILGLSTKEVRLHSAFIAEMLNPKGSHGLGDKMLRSFVGNVIKSRVPAFDFDPLSAQVFVEYYIGAISEDNSEGGRIDILIQDLNKNTIIIENKIYAGDQPLQLSRYNKYAVNTARLSNDKYVILYLTLEGKSANDESVGKIQFEYYSISYKEDILKWLNDCLYLAVLHPSTRETIAQYKLNLESILNIMNESTTSKILDVLTDNANIESALTITSLGEEIKKTIRRKFVLRLEEELAPLLSQHNLVFNKDDIERFTVLSRGYPAIRIYRKSKETPSFSIQVEAGEVYYGLSIDAENLNPKKLKMTEPIWQEANDYWPHGWSYFPGNLKYWGNNEALIDMALGAELLNIIKRELERAIQLHAFDDIDRLLIL